MMIADPAISVSEFIFSVKSLLEGEFRDVSVVGEISNFSLSSAGHYYFTLSDDKSSVSCAFFKFDALRNPFLKRIKDGDKVILRGPVSVYAPRGTFQIVGKRITPFGKGDLKAQFEALKNKLSSQGYFDPEHKVSVPRFPKKIGVITALNGAALQDFLNVIKRRSSWYDIVVSSATVQGSDCARSVIKAFDKLEALGDVDVIVLTRGGGSIEDLWGFNDEILVDKIFKSSIPVISAIGHQTDYTLSDYVADLRAETPSAAAEILSQPHTELAGRMKYAGHGLRSFIVEVRAKLQKRLNRINPRSFQHIIIGKMHDVKQRLEKCNPQETERYIDIESKQVSIADLIERAETSVKMQFESYSQRTILQKKLLSSLDPKNVLNRGYTYIDSDEDIVLTTVDEFDKISKNKPLNIHFKDGVRKVKKV